MKKRISIQSLGAISRIMIYFLGRHWKIFLLGIVVLGIVVASGYGGYVYKGKSIEVAKEVQEEIDLQTPSTELKELPAIVVMVNKEGINRGEFLDRVFLASQSYQAQGVEVNTVEAQAQIRQNIIQSMINEKIIMQYAVRDGFFITEEEINQQVSDFISGLGGQESFEKSMQSQGLTEEYIRKDLERQSVIQKYLREIVDTSDIEITDKEVTDAYNTLLQDQENPQEAPSLEDSFESIKSQLLQQQVQQRTSEYIDTIREESTIKILF